MAWLPDGEKKFVDTFICFDRIHELDRHTNGRTATPHDDMGHTCTASRGKNHTLCSGHIVTVQNE